MLHRQAAVVVHALMISCNVHRASSAGKQILEQVFSRPERIILFFHADSVAKTDYMSTIRLMRFPGLNTCEKKSHCLGTVHYSSEGRGGGGRGLESGRS